MSRPKLKNNKFSYAAMVFTVIYLFPVLTLCTVIKPISFIFIRLDCIFHDFCIKTLDKVNDLFPFKGNDNE